MLVMIGLLGLAVLAGLVGAAKRRTAGQDWAKRRPDDVPGTPGPQDRG